MKYGIVKKNYLFALMDDNDTEYDYEESWRHMNVQFFKDSIRINNDYNNIKLFIDNEILIPTVNVINTDGALYNMIGIDNCNLNVDYDQWRYHMCGEKKLQVIIDLRKSTKV